MMENTTRPAEPTFEIELQEMENIVPNQTFVYILLAALGVALNISVLVRLMRVYLKQADQFFEGCAMPLSVMALSDLLSLISIIILISPVIPFTKSLTFFNWIHSEMLAMVKCKATLFLLHTMTGISKWCWLFISTLRFLAVYHPLWHRRQWRLGNRCVTLIFTISLAINIWLLWAVAPEQLFCTEMPFLGSYETNRYLHAIEILWSYLLPVCVTFVLDARVMFLKPPRLMASNKTQKSCSYKVDAKIEEASKRNGSATNPRKESEDIANSFYKRMLPESNDAFIKAFPNSARYRSTLYHWLTITSLNLILNTPDVLLRLIALFEMPMLSGFLANPSITIAARSLYFAQFVVNAVYLTCFVFWRSVGLNRGRALTITSIKSTEITMKLVEQMNSNSNASAKRYSATDTETTTL